MGEQKKIVAVTMGDPAGIGPEVLLRAFCDDGMWQGAVPVVYGILLLLVRATRRPRVA